MRSEVTGLKHSTLAVTIFLLAFLVDSYFPILLAIGYVVSFEGNRWLTKQAFSALFLKMAGTLANVIVGIFFPFTGAIGLTSLFSSLEVLQGVGVIAILGGLLFGIIKIALFVFTIQAIMNVMHEKDANIPYIKHFFE